MTVNELSRFITENKGGGTQYPYGDEYTICHYVRTVLYQHRYITNEHILECCTKASNYEEFIELCRPLAISDTQKFMKEKNGPASKGRTKRRFR